VKIDDDAAWDDILPEIRGYMEVLFALSSSRDKEVWQYMVGVAAHLEYLAVAVLWIDAGKSVPFPEYEERLTLGQAASRIGALGLLDTTTVKTLQTVAQLRNSVAHRGAVYGVTVAGDDPEHRRGVYKGGHVFSDAGALESLVSDTNAAISAMGPWLRARDATT
jgi:hypothetical protein